MRHGKARFVAGFLALPIALYLFYVIWPFVQAGWYSLTDWGGYSDTQNFVGLKNYGTMFGDELVRKAFWHNVFFLVSLPLSTIVLALFFAFLLNVGGRENRAGIRGVFGSSVYRVIFFFPVVLPAPLVAIMWQSIYRGDDQGLINGVLIKLGLEDPQHPNAFHLDPTPFLGVPKMLWWILLIAVWSGVGFYMVLFSAGMQSIPKDIFEAALLDGAGRVSSFVRITLPLLWESVSVAWVYLGITAMDMFALVYVLAPDGGPDDAGQIFASAIQFSGFRKGLYGYACAVGVALAIITLLLSAIQLRVSRRERIEF